jgi:hypothetical protein
MALEDLQLPIVLKPWISTVEDLYHHCQKLDKFHHMCISHKTPCKDKGKLVTTEQNFHKAR